MTTNRSTTPLWNKVIRGTIGYVSPEQVRGQALAPTHEVYVLARLLWELLTADALGGNDHETLRRMVNGPLPDPLLPRSLAAFEPILQCALDQNPDRRYATPLAFAQTLEALGHCASSDAIGSWIARLDTTALAKQETLFARIADQRIPPGGYSIIEEIARTRESTIYFAARNGPEGPQAVALRRLLPQLAVDPAFVEAFLSEVGVRGEGFAPVDDVGSDSEGFAFRAQPFVPGLDLWQVLTVLRRSRAQAPPSIAVGIISAAARALEGLRSQPAASDRSVVARHLSPGSLQIGLDGRPVWMSLGATPSAHNSVPRRTHVPVSRANDELVA